MKPVELAGEKNKQVKLQIDLLNAHEKRYLVRVTSGEFKKTVPFQK
jgi:hypothetical protein